MLSNHLKAEDKQYVLIICCHLQNSLPAGCCSKIIQRKGKASARRGWQNHCAQAVSEKEKGHQQECLQAKMLL